MGVIGADRSMLLVGDRGRRHHHLAVISLALVTVVRPHSLSLLHPTQSRYTRTSPYKRFLLYRDGGGNGSLEQLPSSWNNKLPRPLEYLFSSASILSISSIIPLEP